jgi:hypothetical protein
MPKLIPEPVQRQLDGLSNMTAHARRLYQQGVLDAGELRKIEVFEAEQRGHIADTETYASMRQDGTWDKLEQVLNDPRSGTAAEREMLARKVAAHKIGQDAVNHQPKDEAEQKAVMETARKRMSEFVDMSDEDADNDLAVYEKAAKITLGDKVSKPVEEPSWSKPVQKISDDDPDVKAFRLRDENTKGTDRYQKAYGNDGVKRAADGRIIAKSTLREDADRAPKKQKILNDLTEKPVGSDRGDGMVVDEWGVMTKGEAEDRERFEQSQANDRAAAAEASPPPPSDPGPVTLANPHEA